MLSWRRRAAHSSRRPRRWNQMGRRRCPAAAGHTRWAPPARCPGPLSIPSAPGLAKGIDHLLVSEKGCRDQKGQLLALGAACLVMGPQYTPSGSKDAGEWSRTHMLWLAKRSGASKTRRDASCILSSPFEIPLTGFSPSTSLLLVSSHAGLLYFLAHDLESAHGRGLGCNMSLGALSSSPGPIASQLPWPR